MSINKGDSVLEAGLEPARPNGHRILSPACLPIPPLEHFDCAPCRFNFSLQKPRIDCLLQSGLNKKCRIASAFKVERKTGFEPATSTLARWRSTN